MHQHAELIEALTGQQWRSGEQLGAQFGLSRTAIWKRIGQLRALGLVIESDRGKGYRLVDSVHLYHAQQIRSGMDEQTVKRITDIHIEMSLDSTNQACFRRLVQTAQTTSPDQTGCVVLAERQTAGKGRRGRNWVSPFGQNIYLSLIWRFPAGAGSLAGLSLVVGLAVVGALQREGYADLTLKWPNDVQWQHRKLAGILLEVSGDVSGACDVVIGIGINVSMRKPAGSAIDQPWVDLAEVNPQAAPNKNRLLSQILNELVSRIEKFQLSGFAVFRDEWNTYDGYVEKPVTLLLGASNSIEGVYRGVNHDGSITLETNAGLRNFSGGEISLRLA